MLLNLYDAQDIPSAKNYGVQMSAVLWPSWPERDGEQGSLAPQAGSAALGFFLKAACT